ncbi:MAG TPA: penicillin-binding protein [Smithellaceae bacterium]|nr:penicillin-binding protein [Smithellaceae bacterium]HQB93191.1 penicillin-binding protein [Smithellaceae bacterium]
MATDVRRWLRVRIVSILVIFLVMFVALISRAFQLQVLSGQNLKALAQRQHTANLQMQPDRGIIYDRNGEKLAISVMADSVCADPSKIINIEATSAQIAKILNLDRKTVLQKISVPKNFCWLARRISPEQAVQIQSADIEGIFLIKEPKRFYPNGFLGAHLLGFVGDDNSGLEGLEYKYDAVLKEKPRHLAWVRDAKGKKLFLRAEKSETEKKEGLNIVLTIDYRIQYLVETHLKEAVSLRGAKGGVAIVMNPKTGEILALANEKGFNPNNVRGFSSNDWRNRAVADVFDPGSTFKPFLVAAALEEKVVKESDKIFCENGSFAIADRTIREANRKRHGYLSVREVLKYSSNIGAAKIAQKLKKEKYSQYLESFGFGAKTGIDLPGEASGILRSVQNWTNVDTATIAFGQGVSVTAIQMISAMSAIANDGVLMRPYIVRGFTDKDNNLVKMRTPEVVRQVISPETAQSMKMMLKEVVCSDDGTGRNANIANVAVAGKTGTAQKFDFSRNVYSSDKVRTSFIGFFPVENPQIAILVILDEPQTDKWGGVAAAPVFKNIGEQMLNCFEIDIRQSHVVKTDVPGNLRLIYTQDNNPEQDLLDADSSGMPDFTGLTIRQALKKAKANSIDLKVSGNGWAVRQYPNPGTPLSGGRVCKVFFEITY